MSKDYAGDSYWLKWAKEHLDAAHERRAQAVASIQTYALWLWPIYTGAVGIGFALAERDLQPWQAYFLAGGSIGLLFVYAAATWARLPPRVRFDPRKPASIVAAHNRLREVQARRMSLTFLIALAATCVASAGLVVAATSKPESPALEVACTRWPRGLAIAVAARVPANQRGELRVRNAETRAQLRVQPFRATAEGTVNQAFQRIPPTNERPLVSMVWTDADGVTRSLARRPSSCDPRTVQAP